MNQSLRSTRGSDWWAYTREWARQQRLARAALSPEARAGQALARVEQDVTDRGLWLRYCEEQRQIPVSGTPPPELAAGEALLDLFDLTESGLLQGLLAGPAPLQWASGPEFAPREPQNVPDAGNTGEY